MAEQERTYNGALVVDRDEPKREYTVSEVNERTGTAWQWNTPSLPYVADIAKAEGYQVGGADAKIRDFFQEYKIAALEEREEERVRQVVRTQGKVIDRETLEMQRAEVQVEEQQLQTIKNVEAKVTRTRDRDAGLGS